MKMFALYKRDLCTLLHDSTILCMITFPEYELDQFSKWFWSWLQTQTDQTKYYKIGMC
jgi:hypothetical protein